MSRRAWTVGVGLAVAALGLVALLRGGGPAPRPGASAVSAAPPRGGAPPLAPAPEQEGPPARSASEAPASRAAGPETGADADFESALRWSLVDLDAVREALPDNMYWEMSAPTDDPELRRWREEERARWNREYGKVLSGTATEEEIDAYYALRRRISEDAVEFCAHLTTHYGDVLPERDLGLLRLASRLHRARLEEMPRKMAEALERKREKDRLREAWLADEAAFESANADSDD